jgi:hypothetical protein
MNPIFNHLHDNRRKRARPRKLSGLRSLRSLHSTLLHPAELERVFHRVNPHLTNSQPSTII